MSKRGFTLIELLVVIAIIGILASIVLVSFPGATKRARDSRVMSAIAQARTEMTSYEANNSTYVGFAVSSSINTEITNNCYAADGSCDLANEWYVRAGTSAQGACIYAPLNEQDGANYYCADSTGIAGKTSTNPAIADCNATSCTCPAGTVI